ncbi:MAG: hypothetical protein ACFB9N_13890 [Geitlerinemataceae cyanobacterium]
MNPNRFKQIQLPSLNSILFFIVLAWALGAIGLGWLTKLLLASIAVLALLPVVALALTQWWVKKNLVVGSCPSCSFELTGVDRMGLQCPSCGEQLTVAKGKFERYAEPGTIDVDIVDSVVDVTPLPPDDSSEQKSTRVE